MTPTPATTRHTLDIFSEDEVAEMLNIKTPTLQTWRSRQQGPVPTKLGKQVFYRGTELRAWFASNLGFAAPGDATHLQAPAEATE